MVRHRPSLKRVYAWFAIAALFTMLVLPAFASSFAQDRGEPVAISIERTLVDKPYEKVLASNGPWFTERLNLGASNQLVVGYEGSYAVDGGVLASFDSTRFKLNDTVVLSGAYFPYTNTVQGELSFQLFGPNDEVYGPFPLTPQPVERLNEADMPLTLGAQGYSGEVLYTYATQHPLTLEKGSYQIVLSDASWQVRTRQTGPEGAYLLRGMLAEAYGVYHEQMIPITTHTTGSDLMLGDDFTDDPLGDIEPPGMNPAYFELEETMLIEEIVINTFNFGEGVFPGLIGVFSALGEPLYVEQAVGYPLEGVENGFWVIEPEIILPPGLYEIMLTDPRIFTYDAFGDPMFYINASPASLGRYDFTGTYKIDFATYKRSTLMGASQSGQASFSVKDFELTVLDKGDRLELIGIYEKMPFSIEVPLVEAEDNYVIGRYEFGADIPGQKAKTSIGASGYVKIMALSDELFRISIDGLGTYERADTEERGGDYNTYAIESSGERVAETLPAYVIKALGAAGLIAAGNVPGPDNPIQMATGLLFPPLVGVVVHVISDALRKQAEAKAAKKKAVMRDKEWYKRQYPNASDETIAMIMLADAMGNTDEPDDDPLAVCDSERSSAKSSSSSSDSGDEAADSAYDEAPEPQEAEAPQEPERQLTERDYMSEEEKAEQGTAFTPEEEIQKPERDSMTLVTGIDGKTSTYEFDPETGEWVNPLTGGVFNQSQYEELQRNLPGNQAWQDQERIRVENRDTEQDRQLAAMLQREKEKAYEERILKKYHVNSLEEARQIIDKQMAIDEASSAKWQQIGNIARGMELAATGVGMAADEAVDFLATRTGFTGKVIHAGYKITKSLASEVADKGYENSNLKSAFVAGAFDGAKNFTDSNTVKNALTVGGETFSRYIAAKPGEEWNAIADGLTTSAASIAQGTLTDYLGGEGFGDLHVVNVKGNKAYVALKTDGKWLGNVVQASTAKRIYDNKAAAQMVKSITNVTSSALNNAVVKPLITDPAVKMVQDLPSK